MRGKIAGQDVTISKVLALGVALERAVALDILIRPTGAMEPWAFKDRDTFAYVGGSLRVPLWETLRTLHHGV